MTTQVLTTSAVLSAFVAVLSVYYWRGRRESASGWFSLLMINGVVFACIRLAQTHLATQASAPVLSRAMLIAGLLNWLLLLAFARSFAGPTSNRRFDWAPFAVGIGMAALIGGTDLVLSSQPLIRQLGGGETFVGVELGPAYVVFPILTTALGGLALARLLQARVWRRQGGTMFVVAFGVCIACVAIDIGATIRRVPLPRFTDLTALPLAVAFSLAQIQRFLDLYENLEQRVEERTLDLARANEELRQEHSRRETLRAQVAESQRLESLGRLAGGVAHDFNNHLFVIIAQTDVLKASGDASEIDSSCQVIAEASGRATDLIKQLMTYARQQPVDPRPVAIGERVRGLQGLIEPLVGSQVEVGIESTTDAVALMDPTGLDQIVMNLSVNARDAMPNGGRLRLRVDKIDARPPDLQPTSEERTSELGYVRLQVSDTGVGVPPDVRDKMFEPFFTTKGVDKGTGLGLATVLSVAQQAGGGVHVESEVGEGTTFSVVFPCHRGTDGTTT